MLVILLQRFALKPEPIKILKGLRSNPFKIFIVVRLIGNCCSTRSPSMSENKTQKVDAALRAASTFWVLFVSIQFLIRILYLSILKSVYIIVL